MKNLKALDISFNKSLAKFPPEIKNLQALKILNLKNTKITAEQVKTLNWSLFSCTIMM